MKCLYSEYKSNQLLLRLQSAAAALTRKTRKPDLLRDSVPGARKNGTLILHNGSSAQVPLHRRKPPLVAKLAKKRYSERMRTVNIGELKNQLSGYLQYVKNGEEIVIRDRSVPVARILPFRHGSAWDQEARLVASGVLKMPEEEMDWSQFFLPPAGNVSREIAVEVAIESRGDQ